MEILNFEGIQYLVRYPRGYEEGKKYPVILFLHGAHQRLSHRLQCGEGRLSFAH